MLKMRLKKRLRHWLMSEKDLSLEADRLQWFSVEYENAISEILNYAEYMKETSTEPLISFTAQVIEEKGQRLLRVSRAFCLLQKYKP